MSVRPDTTKSGPQQLAPHLHPHSIPRNPQRQDWGEKFEATKEGLGLFLLSLRTGRVARVPGVRRLLDLFYVAVYICLSYGCVSCSTILPKLPRN